MLCRSSKATKGRAPGQPLQRDIMNNVNKFVGLAAVAAILAATPSLGADVKVGILGDITGPIEALAGPIVKGAQTAFDEVNANGGILDGGKINVVTGDSACDP